MSQDPIKHCNPLRYRHYLTSFFKLIPFFSRHKLQFPKKVERNQKVTAVLPLLALLVVFIDDFAMGFSIPCENIPQRKHVGALDFFILKVPTALRKIND